MSGLPKEFIERLRLIIPEHQWETVWDSFHIERPITLRINTMRSDFSTITAALEKLSVPYIPVPWKNDALFIAPEFRNIVINSDIYQQGLVYSQNIASQIVPIVLDPQPGEEILDMCAAPGGKTAQITCMIREQGRIAAVEKIKARYFKMKDNFKTLQHNSIHTYLTDAIGLWRKTTERFDRVLLDAPCSSEARFNANNPNSFAHWKLRKIKEASRKQKKLIYSAVNCLKPAGTLVYSTCSFAPEENEAVVEHILNTFPGQLTVESVHVPINNTQAGLISWQGKKLNQSLKNSLRILPDHTMNGFYICKITKNGSTVKEMPSRKNKY